MVLIMNCKQKKSSRKKFHYFVTLTEELNSLQEFSDHYMGIISTWSYK